MKPARITSISELSARTFATVSIKLFKALEDWPVSIAHEMIPKNGEQLPFIVHKKTAEFVYILTGKGKACLGKKTFAVKPGDYVVIPAGIKHRFVTAGEPLTAISVFNPPMTFENLDAAPLKNKK